MAPPYVSLPWSMASTLIPVRQNSFNIKMFLEYCSSLLEASVLKGGDQNWSPIFAHFVESGLRIEATLERLRRGEPGPRWITRGDWRSR